ncbi:MFS transporter [Paenibacillus thermotolerans]|uniref:MFS transporter n=1 Tax=Paenibacillus thermotolerans TaxID=3027807 RepID=UPI0023686E6D|nr:MULTISPECIES: MFS transporter [unclassified Paenibacillus]
MKELLTSPPFLRFWLAGLISQLGDGMTRVAVIYAITLTTDNPMLISMVIVAQLLPTAVFTVFMGPLADRLPLKLPLIMADLFRAAVVLLMIPFHHSYPVLLTLIVLQGIGSALEGPAKSASVPAVAGEGHVRQAVSLNQATGSVMQIAGPAAGGLLLMMEQLNAIFLIDAATYAVSAVLFFMIPALGKSAVNAASSKLTYLESLKEGVASASSLPILRYLLIMLIPVTFAVGILNTNLITLFTGVFGYTGAQYGWLSSSLALGVAAGAALIGPMLLRGIKPVYVLIGGIVLLGGWMTAVIPLDAFRAVFGIAPVFAWCIMIGILNALINVPLSSLFILAAPEELRGRASSLLGFISYSFTIIGLVAGGALTSAAGAVWGTAVSGLLLAASGAVSPLFGGFKLLIGKTEEHSRVPTRKIDGLRDRQTAAGPEAQGNS